MSISKNKYDNPSRLFDGNSISYLPKRHFLSEIASVKNTIPSIDFFNIYQWTNLEWLFSDHLHWKISSFRIRRGTLTVCLLIENNSCISNDVSDVSSSTENCNHCRNWLKMKDRNMSLIVQHSYCHKMFSNCYKFGQYFSIVVKSKLINENIYPDHELRVFQNN